MGQGQEGTLLLSNNAKALDMIRLSSLRPFYFHPYYHNILNRVFGAMDIDFFIGRLHRYETIKREDGTLHSGYPKLIGMQFSFHPWNLFHIGLYQTAMFGGGGRDESWNRFWKLISPLTNDNYRGTVNEAGEKKAGLTFAWYLPNIIQALKLYGEWAGEKSAGDFSSHHSYLYGILLSDTAGIQGLQSSYEHLHIDGWQNIIYTDGYSNAQSALGYYIGERSTHDIIRINYLHTLQSNYTIAWEHTQTQDSNRDTLRFAFRHRTEESMEYSLYGAMSKGTLWFGTKITWLF